MTITEQFDALSPAARAAILEALLKASKYRGWTFPFGDDAASSYARDAVETFTKVMAANGHEIEEYT